MTASLSIGNLNAVKTRIIVHYLIGKVIRFCENKNMIMYGEASCKKEFYIRMKNNIIYAFFK